MAKKSETVFDRAEQIAKSGSSRDCESIITELNQLQSDEQSQADDVRPPGEPIYVGGGRVGGTMPAGPKFQEAAQQDEPDGQAAVADCTLQYNRLVSRLAQIAQLLNALGKRKTAAQAEEQLSAAPGKAKRAITALDALADRHHAAREELAAINAELKATFQTLIEARKLNPSAPTVTRDQFYRLGVELAHTLPERRQAVEGGSHGPQRVSTPLFGYPIKANEYVRILVDIPTTLYEKTRRLLARRSSVGSGADTYFDPDTSDRAVRDRLNIWYEEFVRLMGEGSVDAAEQLGPPSYRRGRPVFERQDS